MEEFACEFWMIDNSGIKNRNCHVLALAEAPRLISVDAADTVTKTPLVAGVLTPIDFVAIDMERLSNVNRLNKFNVFVVF